MRALILAAITAGCVSFAASDAQAGPDDRMLSAFVGLGAYTIPDHSPGGTVVGLEYERGFSDTLSLRVSGLGGYYFRGGGSEREPDPDASFTAQTTVGLTYFLDVLKYVPYVNVGIGGVYIAKGPGDGKLNGLVEVGFGLDVLHSREISYGVQVRFDSFAQETSVFSAGLRATYRWGFF